MRLEQLRESSVDLKTIENCFKQHLSFYKVITKTFLSYYEVQNDNVQRQFVYLLVARQTPNTKKSDICC